VGLEGDGRDQQGRGPLRGGQVRDPFWQELGDRVRHLLQEWRVREEPELVEVDARALPRRQDELPVELGGRDQTLGEVVRHRA
jgi:hypothetical protein